MNASSRNATRVDRAALGATFAAAVLTVCVSTVMLHDAGERADVLDLAGHVARHVDEGRLHTCGGPFAG